jgi:predicted ribosome quality control (RQC) complex YloA/Tae2 family protein
MYWFTASDGTRLFLGKDKYENEELIAHGWPEDIWFHVDGLSSAHVFVSSAPNFPQNKSPRVPKL